MQSLLVESHESFFLETGYLLLLQFQQGFAPFRITGKQWSRLEPWPLGAIAARGNLAVFDSIQDAQSNHFLEPYTNDIIYQTFWGVTPARVRVYPQFPPYTDLGSMQQNPRTVNPTGATSAGDVGYIDGETSPFHGPFSKKTEFFTVKEKYPQFQAFNPLYDAMYNAMIRFDQYQYSYQIIKDRALIKDMLVGRVAVKKYTMGLAYPNPTSIPDWLKRAVGDDELKFTLDVMAGRS
jgi:hypothetical protein